MDYFDLMNFHLTEDDIAIKKAAHKFAREIMRPVAKQLDTMSAEEVVAPGSPLWGFLKQAYEQGYHCYAFPAEVGGPGLTPLQQHLVAEELGWGSFGLTVLLGVAYFPFFLAASSAMITGDMELVDKFVRPYCECKDGSIRGCWAITEPDHGSDVVNADPNVFWSVQARPDGDEWVINGQKSAWVSGGTIANYAALFCGVDPSMGMAGGGVFFCPLDLPGVSKGRPLEKVGQRDLNQGEIYFDNVRIPKKYLLFGPEMFLAAFENTLSGANAFMGVMATGLARAAFEEALTYAKVRVQGGRPIIEHQSVRQRLFEMFAKVETSRAISRNVSLYNGDPRVQAPLLDYASVAKVVCTQNCFDVAHAAVQILGGNGLTREYLTEKLFRDARATLIEDGNNEVLCWNGGKMVAETYPRAR